MRSRNYSGDEDEALREHYPEWGAAWDGWAGLLPGRTENSIRSRARHLGLRFDSALGAGRATLDQVMRSSPTEEHGAAITPDPEEPRVMALMAQGLAPSEIDERERWLPNTAKRILMHRWAREGP